MSPLPCFYALADVERELRVPAPAILCWVRRGDLRPAATDPGGRPLFRASDVAVLGRQLAAREPVRLLRPPRTVVTPQLGGHATA
jgi:hypothetical protein